MHKVVDYQIQENIVTLSEGMQNAKRLAVVKWADNPARLELRQWLKNEEGEKPGKGVTLTADEARALYVGLRQYLDSLDE